MAAAIESFSIREYAEKMRSVDVGKCWPFDFEGREASGRLLPPISSRKFRWWADELGSERFNAEAEACSTPARVGGRGKQKAPKKRSIVELFAVAPPVETVEEDDDGECDETDGVRFDLDEGVQERNQGGNAGIRRKQIRLKQIKKITASKKVKSHTFKLAAGAVSSIPTYSSRKTKLKHPTGDHTNKKRAQVSKTGQSCKSIRALKLSVKKHEVAPLRSILKNRIASNKKPTVLASRPSFPHIKSCGELIKHVSFSDKDDILGHSNKDENYSAAIEGLQVEKENLDVSLSSLGFSDRPDDKNNHSSDDVLGISASIIDPDSSLKNKSENFDLNENDHMANYSTNLHCHQDSSKRQILDSSTNEDLSSNIRNHVPGVSHNSFHCRICVPRSDSTYSQKVAKNSVFQPSAASKITEIRPANLSSSSNCSSVSSMNFLELMRASDPMFFAREKIIGEDFIGLPLNSQGELVKLGSSCDFINPFKKHNAAPGSFHGSLVLTHMEPLRKTSQEKMKQRFPTESIHAKDLLQVLPTEAEKFELVHGEDPYKVSCNARNLQNCACQKDRSAYLPVMDFENNVSQPTMRLMGTTVTVGEISKASNGFDGVKVWADKKITAEDFPRTSVFLGSCSEQWPEQDKLLLSSPDHQTLRRIPLVCPEFDRRQAQMAVGLSSTTANLAPTGHNAVLPPHCDSVKRSIESVHPKPVIPSVPQDISHQWLLNYANCKHNQNLSSIKSSPSNNLFRNNTSGCFAQPSSVFSSPYQSQWLINGQIIPFIRYPTPYVGANFLSHPSPCSKSLNALPVYNTLNPNTGGSSPSASLGHHSFVAGYPANNHGHKTKKRFAEKGHEFIRPLKKANELLPAQSCSVSIQAGRARPHMLYPRNRDAEFFFESSPEHHAEQNVLKISQNMNPSSRLGPLKLRAGAKHVLEPCRNSDQKSSRLIYSATPLVDRNGSSRIVISHKKLEEIYSF